MTIHDFDMARFVVGSEVVEVFARGAVRSTRRSPSRRRRHRGDHAGARERLPDDDRQLAPARYGYDQRVEVFGAEGMAASGNPLAAHGDGARPPPGRRRATCPTSSSSATCRATCANGRRSWARSRPGRRRPSGARRARAARRPAWRPGSSVREGRAVRSPRRSRDDAGTGRCGFDGSRSSHVLPATRRRDARAVAAGSSRGSRRDAESRDAARGHEAIVHAAIWNSSRGLLSAAPSCSVVDASRAVIVAADAAGARRGSSRPAGCSTARRARRSRTEPPNPDIPGRRPEGRVRRRWCGSAPARDDRVDQQRPGRPRARPRPCAQPDAGFGYSWPRSSTGCARARVHRLGRRRAEHARLADARDRRRLEPAGDRGRGRRQPALMRGAHVDRDWLARRAAAASGWTRLVLPGPTPEEGSGRRRAVLHVPRRGRHRHELDVAMPGSTTSNCERCPRSPNRHGPTVRGTRDGA